ncbi:MAG: DUF2088 domain-containing protein [Acidobacteria bacterium]|nr:DUF2088 domain-containing protein [Acidobacteriota bacterium]
MSDATREEPRAPLVRAIAPALRAARESWLVVATGSHDPRSPATVALASELEGLLRAEGVPVGRVILHDAIAGPFTDFGVTSRGTPVRLDARAMEAEGFFVLSDMKPHYFAGYSCPPKFVFPGLAAMEAIEANHSFTLDPRSRAGHHPWHPEAARRTNPLAEDYVEAFDAALSGRPAFALTFGSSGDEIFWAEAGELEDAASRGMVRADAISHVVTEPARFAVISPGGYPNDIDLYIAQRALELCGDAVEDGGDILFLCECSGGVGPAHTLPAFWEPLRGNLTAAAAPPQGPYRLYSHKAVNFARLILRLSALHLHAALAPEEIGAAHMVAVTDPQAVIGEWLAMDPDARILLFDGASKLSVSRP